MQRDQEHMWERERRVVRTMQDRLGKPVDHAVAEMVVALRILGFDTHSSCGGHFDQAASPYVAFRSPANVRDRQRIEETDDSVVRRRLKKRAVQHNAGELARLLGYIERFYEDRDVPQVQRLIVQGFGLIGYRLTTQSADLVHVVAKNERHELVESQRHEFDAFAAFLKAKFCETEV